MHLLSVILWNGSPEIFSQSILNLPLSIRWYGLLFAAGFLISQQLLLHIFKKEGKPLQDVDTLTWYMVIATILGARLGHVLFYQPEMLTEDPIGVFLPISLHPFRFTGFTGLASHGGAIGILTALWLYARKKKPGQSFLQIVDRIVILCAITGACIRLGNFFNSEIIGKPTEAFTSVVFLHPVTEAIVNPNNPTIESVEYRNADEPSTTTNRTNVYLYLYFKKGTAPAQAESFVQNELRFYLSRASEFIDQPYNANLNEHVQTLADGTLTARVTIAGISRHPAQLYESLSCIILFIFLFWIWNKKKENTPAGLLFGIFMVYLWTLRFLYEFLKENQVEFENHLPLNMGQILSIPMILVGVYLIYQAYQKKSDVPTSMN